MVMEVNRSEHPTDEWIDKYRSALAASDGVPGSQSLLTRVRVALANIQNYLLSRIAGVLHRNTAARRLRLLSPEPGSLPRSQPNLEASRSEPGSRQAPEKAPTSAERTES